MILTPLRFTSSHTPHATPRLVFRFIHPCLKGPFHDSVHVQDIRDLTHSVLLFLNKRRLL